MFFLPLLVVPTLLETIGTVLVVTTATRVANDVYDAAKKKGESDE